MPASDGFYVPSWSPDGKYMVAIAENPSRMVLYSMASKTWKDLKIFKALWPYWVWANDGKSIYFAIREEGLDGEPGIYQLTIRTGEWDQVAKLNGVTVNLEEWGRFSQRHRGWKDRYDERHQRSPNLFCKVDGFRFALKQYV